MIGGYGDSIVGEWQSLKDGKPTSEHGCRKSRREKNKYVCKFNVDEVFLWENGFYVYTGITDGTKVSLHLSPL